MTETIRFYDADGTVTGDATLEDGQVRYSNEAIRSIMENSVLNLGPDRAWKRFSKRSNGYSSSALVTE